MDAPWVEVAAAVIERADGQVLMASRPPGKAYAGWWEFPGGKIEAGENARQALVRELQEELGITATRAWPWLTRQYAYPHARVRLRFFRVTEWEGEPHPHEGQQLAWTPTHPVGVEPVLPANGPLLRGLRLPLEYAISAAADLGAATFLAALDVRLKQGLRFVQLREKQLDADAFAALAHAVAARCRAHDALLALNGNADLAATLGVGLHMTAAQLMRAETRPDLPWVGASCHTPEELARAAALGLDWVVIGPVRATASHPGAPGLGWDTLAEWLRDYPLPAYALGGLDAQDIDQARRQGAHGVALRGAAWKGGACA